MPMFSADLPSIAAIKKLFDIARDMRQGAIWATKQ